MIQMIYMGILCKNFSKKFKRKPLLFFCFRLHPYFYSFFLLFFHSQQDADQAFSKYTSELFRQEISGNTITPLHLKKSRKIWHRKMRPFLMDNVPPIPNWSGLVSMRNGPDFAPITEHLFPKTTVLLMMC